MATSAGLSQFQLQFELAPIFLANGIAQGMAGQVMSILALIQPDSDSLTSADDFFAHFAPMPGATLIDNDIADYPFANQTVAANSIIARPLRLPMLMTCPANGPGAYLDKINTLSNLKASLDLHNQSGGSYIVATPSYIYSGCLLQNIHDVSNSQSKQVQSAWQWDFILPLLTIEAAQYALNSLLTKINSGLPITGQPTNSGPGSTVGNAVTGATSPAGNNSSTSGLPGGFVSPS